MASPSSAWRRRRAGARLVLRAPLRALAGDARRRSASSGASRRRSSATTSTRAPGARASCSARSQPRGTCASASARSARRPRTLEDRFGIASSNSVVFEVGDRFETVDRPTEGTFYEALYRLRSREAALVYATHGAGEGDLYRDLDAGFSGLAAALHTEGFRIREFVTATAAEVPEDADLVLALAPRRRAAGPRLSPRSTATSARGGRLVAFLEPGVESGLEEVLGRWGLASQDALLVDPASGAVAGDAAGREPPRPLLRGPPGRARARRAAG